MKRQSTGDKVVNVIFYIILGFFVILCFYPVWYAFLASFSWKIITASPFI